MAENLSLTTKLQAALLVHDQPDPTRVLGMDTSHWSGIVDMQKAKENGIRFVFIKYLDGQNGPTRYMEENYRAAVDADLVVGSFGWLYAAARPAKGKRKAIPGVSPAAQARRYTELLRDYPVAKNMAYIDYEWTVPVNPDASDLRGFIEPFEQAYGEKVGIYSALGYVNQYPVPVSYAGNPLWVAQYRVQQPDPIKPWNSDWKFWQFTAVGDGAKYGFPRDGERNADLNYWVGDLDSFYRYCGVTQVPPVPPTEPPAPPADGPTTYWDGWNAGMEAVAQFAQKQKFNKVQP